MLESNSCLQIERAVVSEAIYILRAAEDRVSAEELLRCDQSLRDSLDGTLSGELCDDSFETSCRWVCARGALNWKIAGDLALSVSGFKTGCTSGCHQVFWLGNSECVDGMLR